MKVIGVLLLIAGALFGAYVGVWVCFIGGIVDVITEIRAVDMSAMGVAIGIAKVCFAGPLGVLSASIPIMLGSAMVEA